MGAHRLLRDRLRDRPDPLVDYGGTEVTGFARAFKVTYPDGSPEHHGVQFPDGRCVIALNGEDGNGFFAGGEPS